MSGFTSNTFGQTIYDERNASGILTPPGGLGKGFQPRDLSSQPFGSVGTREWRRDDYVPRDEWPERCEEIEKNGRLASQQLRKAGVPPKNQLRTSSCWAQCVVAAMESRRCLDGKPYVALSPASASGPIKGYRDVGGWPGEAVDYIRRNGVAEASVWPPNAIDRREDNAESRDSRKLHTIKDAIELPPGDFDAEFSALLRGMTLASGYMWWGHAVEDIDPVCLGRNDFGKRVKNSWGDWEDEGYGILREGKGTSDGAIAIAHAY